MAQSSINKSLLQSGLFLPLLAQSKVSGDRQSNGHPQEGNGGSGGDSRLQDTTSLLLVTLPQGRPISEGLGLAKHRSLSLNSYCYFSSSWVRFQHQSTLPISIMALPHIHLAFQKYVYTLSPFSPQLTDQGIQDGFSKLGQLTICQLISICRLNRLSYLCNLSYHQSNLYFSSIKNSLVTIPNSNT